MIARRKQHSRDDDGLLDDDRDYGRRDNWRIEKGVSISLVLFLLIQTISIVWFASKVTAQVEQNTNDITVMKADEKDREKTRADMIAKLSSIDQSLRDLREITFQGNNRQQPNQVFLPPSSNGSSPQVILNQAAPDQKAPSRIQ